MARKVQNQIRNREYGFYEQMHKIIVPKTRADYTDDEIQDLVDKIRDQDDIDAFQELVLLHIPTAKAIARQTCIQSHLDIWTCQAEGFALLVDAVERIRKGNCSHTNYTSYIVKIIRCGLVEYSVNDHIVRIPRKTASRNNLDAPIFFSMNNSDQAESVSKEIATNHYTKKPRFPIQEILAEITMTEREFKIVREVLNGKTFKVIGSEVGVSESQVGRILKGLKRRFKEVL